jgi:hypothetical protein
MFDLYCNTDRFWHEISRTNELCSQRSGSKVRERIIYLLGLIPDGEGKYCGVGGKDLENEFEAARKVSASSRYLWRSFCCATKDKYLIINFACTTAWLYPAKLLKMLRRKRDTKMHFNFVAKG